MLQVLVAYLFKWLCGIEVNRQYTEHNQVPDQNSIDMMSGSTIMMKKDGTVPVE